MEITTRVVDIYLEVSVQGRLDGAWSDHLSGALDELVRQGHHHIQLNLRDTVYISSLGIRVLVQFHKKLTAIEGSFVVCEPAPSVKKVLDMVGLSDALMANPAVRTATTPAPAAARDLERPHARLQVFALDAPATGMAYRPVGDPSLLEARRFDKADCRAVAFPESAFGVGIGAFGGGFDESRDRFGEFLCVAGLAACQPSDGSNVSDFLVTEGTLVPSLQVLYGLVSSGQFTSLARFEAREDKRAVGLSELVDAAFEIAAADHLCVCLVAESAGLVGATLRRPPIGGAPGSGLFDYPEVGTWLSFTTERTHVRALTVVVGFASRKADTELAGLLRPLGGSPYLGHFHASAFSYRPLPRGAIDLRTTVRAVFEAESLLEVLHLVADDRRPGAVSESEFVRGACWIAPMTRESRQGGIS
jgi:anti-anti-sigma factor